MPAATATAPSRRAAARAPARPARSRSPAARPMPVRLVPLAVGRTAGAVSGIAESGLVHRLTRGRLWIGALTTLLVGIVAVNVVALSFNAQASKTGREADTLDRQISMLRARIADAGVSNTRVQAVAAGLGLSVPNPASIRYLTSSHSDAAIAAKRLESGELVAGSPVGAPPTVAAVPSVPAAPSATAPTAPAQSPVATPPPTTATATGTTGAQGAAPTAAAPSPPPSGGAPPTGGGTSAP